MTCCTKAHESSEAAKRVEQRGKGGRQHTCTGRPVETGNGRKQVGDDDDFDGSDDSDYCDRDHVITADVDGTLYSDDVQLRETEAVRDFLSGLSKQ